MSNIINKYGFNPIMRLSARGLRLVGFPAGTKPIGTRRQLYVGREDRSWNNPLWGKPLTPPLNMTAITAEVADFAPKNTREVLEKMVSFLRAQGNDPVAEYYFGMADGKYRNVVNTNEARSIILSVAFDGEKIARVDRRIVEGKIKKPINDVIHFTRIILYGINPLLIKLSAYLGFPNSFIILPVFDADGKVIGKVNIGLRDTVRLSPDKIEVLRLLAEKIKGTNRGNGAAQTTIDIEQVRKFISYVDSIPLYKFVGLRAVAEGTRRLVSMLSSSMETTLTEKVKRERAYREAMITLVNTIEAKEHSTGGHSVRVAKLAAEIGQRLPDQVWFDEMKRCGVKEADWEQTIEREKGLLYYHALIHDIGKVGISDAVLNKPGKLDPEERAEMQRHVEIGRKRIMRTEERFEDNPFFNQSALDVVGFHHVAYNGREGYPDAEGKKETQLPLAARIVYAADCYDAMVSKRCYKERLEPEETINELVKGVGTQFDPAVVRTMLDIFSARPEENDADSYFMIEEILQVLGTETVPELRYLPERLMSRLRGNSRVADLEPFLARMRQDTGILPESETWYGEMAHRVQEKKRRLIAHAALGVRFYDSVAVKAIKTFSDYINSGHYSPEAVRDFMGELSKAWQQSTDPKFIPLAVKAFNNAGAKAADFKSFFFEPNPSEPEPTPTPT